MIATTEERAASGLDEGITILLSSHLLAEVQEICNRVAVINEGRIVHEGSLAELGASGAPHYHLRTTDTARAAAVCATLDSVRDLRVDNGELTFTLANDQDAIALTRALADAGVGIASLVREHVTLEELFFRLTKREPAQTQATGVAA